MRWCLALSLRAIVPENRVNRFSKRKYIYLYEHTHARAREGCEPTISEMPIHF